MLSFALHNVDITSFEKVLKTLDSTKASEIDQISVLKDGAPVIAIHLANIINLSIKIWYISIDKQDSKNKTGIKTETKNYRPISLLPLTSKVVEKLIHNQTQNYKEMTHHSTDTCLSQLTNMILNCADNGKHTGMILIDL